MFRISCRRVIELDENCDWSMIELNSNSSFGRLESGLERYSPHSNPIGSWLSKTVQATNEIGLFESTQVPKSSKTAPTRSHKTKIPNNRWTKSVTFFWDFHNFLLFEFTWTQSHFWALGSLSDAARGHLMVKTRKMFSFSFEGLSFWLTFNTVHDQSAGTIPGIRRSVSKFHQNSQSSQQIHHTLRNFSLGKNLEIFPKQKANVNWKFSKSKRSLKFP